jgi:hypothetical protein
LPDGETGWACIAVQKMKLTNEKKEIVYKERERRERKEK